MHEAELHCHTKYSKGTSLQPIECIASPLELLKSAKRHGLSMIAITDHNTMDGYIEAKKYAKKIGITLVPAEEIDVKEGGHILAYGIRRPIRPHQPARVVVAQIHKQGGLAVVAHPYDILHPMNALAEIIPDIDGAECLTFGTLNNRNARMKITKQIPNALLTTGSDAHSPRLAGALRMMFSDDCKTPAQYLRAMRRRECTYRVAIPYGLALFWGLIHILRMTWLNLRSEPDRIMPYDTYV
jgi:predicted metal-dependent phosphoesterase TrpH